MQQQCSSTKLCNEWRKRERERERERERKKERERETKREIIDIARAFLRNRVIFSAACSAPSAI
jgi:hypothetical protein